MQGAEFAADRVNSYSLLIHKGHRRLVINFGGD